MLEYKKYLEDWSSNDATKEAHYKIYLHAICRFYEKTLQIRRLLEIENFFIEKAKPKIEWKKDEADSMVDAIISKFDLLNKDDKPIILQHLEENVQYGKFKRASFIHAFMSMKDKIVSPSMVIWLLDQNIINIDKLK